ncbi:unnamed protein product [Lupinus luteus]|uniref:Uncharacterized protein n=1 Tax=Lupinus luteus TaxID=3873 RepID=A0AAV1XSQ7_LUPLU
MVHGYAASQGFFFRNFDALSSHFRVIAIDQLCWGGSSRPDFTCRTTEGPAGFSSETERITKFLETWKGSILNRIWESGFTPQKIIRETLNAPGCEAAHITEIEASIECDTFMPQSDTIFQLWYSSFPLVENIIRYSFNTYVHVRSCKIESLSQNNDPIF